jgi:SGNH hydrolase-like domain, acetyltransferase AlgX
MDDQANLLAEFAAEQDISFLDLTSYFQKEADAGAELYYPYDTHWNQIGHDLAAEAIARFMKDMLSIRDNLSR